MSRGLEMDPWELLNLKMVVIWIGPSGKWMEHISEANSERARFRSWRINSALLEGEGAEDHLQAGDDTDPVLHLVVEGHDPFLHAEDVEIPDHHLQGEDHTLGLLLQGEGHIPGLLLQGEGQILVPHPQEEGQILVLHPQEEAEVLLEGMNQERTNFLSYIHS